MAESLMDQKMTDRRDDPDRKELLKSAYSKIAELRASVCENF